MGHRRRWHPLWLISAIGVLIWSGFLWNLVVELRTLAAVGPPLLTFLLGTGLSVPLVVAGYWWQGEPWIDPSTARRIVGWGIGGLAFISTIEVLTVAIRIAENRTVAEPQIDVLVSVAAGTVAGASLGYLYERTRHDKARAQDAREAMDFLNRTLRHECLNGLNIIQGRTAQVAATVDDEEAADRLETIRTRSEDMADLVQNLRALAEPFGRRAAPEPVDLSAMLTRRLDLLCDTHPSATVTEEIPPDVHVRAGPGIERVFENVLQNAVEHNDKETTVVTVEVEVADESVAVRVADDGPGIPPAVRDRLFDPDLDRDHRIGLHLVKRLVTQYDGTLDVADDDPEGTVVTITLPRAGRED